MDNRVDRAVKMEDPIPASSFSSYFTVSNPAASFLDYAIEEKGSLGFVELLGVHDFGSSSTSEWFQEPASSVGPRVQTQILPPVKTESPYTPAIAPESPELLNAPATPNSSSISSESCGAPNINDDLSKPIDEEEEQHKTKKHLTATKTSQKRQREPRFAFMTKSEVDHLEDGYRWRKYGQKAVKNSPFPRSYYRCTNATCNVKKRVERSFNDPSVVVTTYEGQHTHPSPMMLRSSPAGITQAQAQVSGLFPCPAVALTLSQQLQLNSLTPWNCGFTSNRNPAGALGRRFCTPPSALLRDDGLLQDIVPSTMRKEE